MVLTYAYTTKSVLIARTFFVVDVIWYFLLCFLFYFLVFFRVDKMNYGLILAVASLGSCYAADILMITMGGTKSHKIPFLELAKGLTPR